MLMTQGPHVSGNELREVQHKLNEDTDNIGKWCKHNKIHTDITIVTLVIGLC